MFEAAHLLGILLALGAALSLAAQDLFIRFGTDDGSTFSAVFIVMVVNLVVLTPAVAVLYYPTYVITPISIVSFVLAGILGTAIGRVLKYGSIARIGASRTAPIIAAQALFASILSVLLLDESLVPIHGVGVVLVVSGIGFISWETNNVNPDELPQRELAIGLLLPFLAALAYSLEPILINYGYAEGTPAPVGLLVKTFAATIGFLTYLRWHDAIPDSNMLYARSSGWFLFAGIANTLFLIGYYVSLAFTPVNIVIPVIITNTLFVVLLSMLFMPQRLERVTWRLGAASTVVVVGVLIITIYG